MFSENRAAEDVQTVIFKEESCTDRASRQVEHVPHHTRRFVVRLETCCDESTMALKATSFRRTVASARNRVFVKAGDSNAFPNKIVNSAGE